MKAPFPQVGGCFFSSTLGKSYLLKQGEFIVMPANEPHALKGIKKFKMILKMIRSWFSWLHTHRRVEGAIVG